MQGDTLFFESICRFYLLLHYEYCAPDDTMLPHPGTYVSGTWCTPGCVFAACTYLCWKNDFIDALHRTTPDCCRRKFAQGNSLQKCRDQPVFTSPSRVSTAYSGAVLRCTHAQQHRSEDAVMQNTERRYLLHQNAYSNRTSQKNRERKRNEKQHWQQHPRSGECRNMISPRESF